MEMTGIGMSLTEYTSEELEELQFAIMDRMDWVDKREDKKSIEILTQWEVKVYEAKLIVLKKELELLN